VTPRPPDLRLGQIPRLGALWRSHFLSGLLVVIPTGVIVWIVVAALQVLWRLPDMLPSAWQPETWLPNPTLALLVNTGLMLGLVGIIALLVSLLGWVSKQLLGQKILEFLSEHVIKRIPVLRSIYSALDQLLRTLAAGGGHQFSRVVYVEYPRKGLWTLAFVTGKVRQPGLPAGFLNIYVPTTPNPTSGFHLMVDEAEVRESQMSVEEAFKTLLSLGIAQGQTDSRPPMKVAG